MPFDWRSRLWFDYPTPVGLASGLRRQEESEMKQKLLNQIDRWHADAKLAREQSKIAGNDGAERMK